MIKGTCTVYGLTTTADNRVIRYIGQTTKSLNARLNAHITSARKGVKGPRFSWIRKRELSGFDIEIVVLQENAIWNESEIEWIAKFRECSIPLLNLTDGGGGVVGWKKSEEVIAAHKDKMSEKYKDPEFRAKLSASIKASRTDEVINKIKLALSETFQIEGELLTLTDISKLTGIDREALRSRLKRGASIEEAMSIPINHKRKEVKYSIGAEVYSLKELSTKYSIPIKTLRYRLEIAKWSLDCALKTPVLPAKLATAKLYPSSYGISLTLRQLSELFEIPYHRVRSRIRLGWSVDEITMEERNGVNT